MTGQDGTPPACPVCLRRAWLLGRLADHLNRTSSRSADITAALALDDDSLVAAVGGSRRAQIERELREFDPARALGRCRRAGADPVCRHDDRYPQRLTDLPSPPSVLHAAGDAGLLTELDDAVAIVGARRASTYGLEVARRLGRDLAVAGVPVVSGMALGIDSAAHAGTLEVGGRAVAVLGGGSDVVYPASKRHLHEKLVAQGCVVSEMPPGIKPRAWCFPARNRLIAALARVVVVVEGGKLSGSLITARWAADLGRDVGAVPGWVTSPVAAGPNALIRDGAQMVEGAGDVLDLLFGAGAGGPAARQAAEERRLSGLEPRLRAAFDAVAAGADTPPALAAVCPEAGDPLMALAELELLGLIRREGGPGYRLADRQT